MDTAKRSPKSGRFETNVNAKEWHLVSPEGKHYQFRSLNCWPEKMAENYLGVIQTQGNLIMYDQDCAGQRGQCLGKNMVV